MDPYLARLAALLGDRDPIVTLRATPARLDAAAADPRTDWNAPWRPGGWTGREIVAHLSDQEIGFSFRARQAVAAAALAREADAADGEGSDAEASHAEGSGTDGAQAGRPRPLHVAQPYDQDAWARAYSRMDPALAIASFGALRAWNLAWLARLELADWLASYHHPERDETETVDELVRFLAGHDLNHLAQLDAIVAG
ncbi:MAG: DinB family protein [Trueperaceae bacterium]|nr:DinB family protein [Trueperaceae bacterium]